MSETVEQPFEQTLEQFLASDNFKDAVIASTKAGWGGSGYSVELMPGGNWYVVWDNQIGNLYETPGVILGVPALNDSDYQDMVNADENPIDEEEFFDLCFEAEGDDLAQEMRDNLAS